MRPTDTTKHCSGCNKVLALSSFGLLPSRNGRLVSICKECSREQLKLWRSTVRGKQLLKEKGKVRRQTKRYAEWNKAHSSRPDVISRSKVYKLRWASKNREASRAKAKIKRQINAERDKAKRREYLKTDRGKATMLRWTYRRRASFAGAICTLTAAEWIEVKAEYRNLCAYCRQRKTLTIDHVIPISRSGDHTKYNIVPACRSCNAKKGNKIIERPLPSGPIFVL